MYCVYAQDMTFKCKSEQSVGIKSFLLAWESRDRTLKSVVKVCLRFVVKFPYSFRHLADPIWFLGFFFKVLNKGSLTC